MAFLKSLATTTTVIAASALPFALTSLSSSSSSTSQLSSSCSHTSKFPNFPFLSLPSIFRPDRSGLVKSFTQPPSALRMEAPTSENVPSTQNGAILLELLTEFMVDMKCDGCVKSVKSKIETVDGVKSVEVDLDNQVVRVLGCSSVKSLTDALEQTGRKARLIGQGVPEDFSISAAVAEFKGPEIFGVVRLAQVNMELARIEVSFSGLSPGKHGWSINEFGDLTRGAASTGKVFHPTNQPTDQKPPLGDLGTLEAGENGEAFFSGAKEMVRVGDLIGRALVVYGSEDKSDAGIAAAVIARSAGVGENYKKLCTCDGTTIWESSDRDFVISKV
uniref:Superoxide dismutase copper chaperone n=1 Tax=Paeonia ostii TaxID=459177 RepID=A0A977TQ93_9MAGN|nr:copper chaperone for superoxide dismutase [Paeonia ostii]